MAANILSVENQQGVDIVASDQFPSTQPFLFLYIYTARGSRSGLNANRYVVSSVLGCQTDDRDACFSTRDG